MCPLLSRVYFFLNVVREWPDLSPTVAFIIIPLQYIFTFDNYSDLSRNTFLLADEGNEPVENTFAFKNSPMCA